MATESVTLYSAVPEASLLQHFKLPYVQTGFEVPKIDGLYIQSGYTILTVDGLIYEYVGPQPFKTSALAFVGSVGLGNEIYIAHGDKWGDLFLYRDESDGLMHDCGDKIDPAGVKPLTQQVEETGHLMVEAPLNMRIIFEGDLEAVRDLADEAASKLMRDMLKHPDVKNIMLGMSWGEVKYTTIEGGE